MSGISDKKTKDINPNTHNGNGAPIAYPVDNSPIVTFEAAPCHSSPSSKFSSPCPFGNEFISFTLRPGCCVRLAGNSGAGKTTLVTYLANLSSKSQLSKLGINVLSCEWNASIPEGERCGVLFQQTTLLDALTLAGNIALALQACPSHNEQHFHQQPQKLHAKIKQLLEAVGLDYARDANKRPSQLSGGMARRASLALQLAQKKRVIVLDEPFTGLDREASISVAKELIHLRVNHGTALVLISHEPDLADMVMDPTKTTGNQIITLQPPRTAMSDRHEKERTLKKPSLFGTTFFQRYIEDLCDFVIWSFPLITLAFLACGIAIAMLSSDILSRIDVTEKVVSIVDQEVKPLIKMLTGEEAGPLTMMMVNMKVKGMLNTVMPEAKANLYALGMAKLFVLEIGPLLTALLLCGRIGGSYAGKVATMQATAQNKLLKTLGINAQLWTLVPALSAAVAAAPLLTVVGTALALFLGALVGPRYGIGSFESYIREVRQAVFPTLRLRAAVQWKDSEWWEGNTGKKKTIIDFISSLDFRCSFSDSYKDALLEVVTYPPCFLLIKSVAFIFIILITAEAAARIRSTLTPRNVPSVITSSVVIASLLIIVADWGFSQLWLLRK